MTHSAPRRRLLAVRKRSLDRDWVLALALAFFVAVVVWFGRSVQDFFAPAPATCSCRRSRAKRSTTPTPSARACT